ncbi:hypothetical protein K501DRAFT_243367 [Backusella circina FSU 941]|nr:hypothetical protein K501DRAFT_243367 [Backusella circina FSU 941]
MSSQLAIDSNLLNSKFEGYKLDPFSSTVVRTPVQSAQFKVNPTDHRVGFRDLQARIRHSQLSYGYPIDENRAAAFYVDEGYCLIAVVYNKVVKQTYFYPVITLAKPFGHIPSYAEPDENVPIDHQIPSVIAISSKLVLVSNGVGDIELIGLEQVDDRLEGVVLGHGCYMGDGLEGVSPVPCVLLSARQVKNKIIFVVHSRTASKTTEFNISTLEMNIPTAETKHEEDGSFSLFITILSIQRGPEVPVYCSISPSGQLVIFGSETRYARVKEHNMNEETESTADTPMEVEQTPAYKWSQDGADLTVQFQLPVDTPKSAIFCKFVPDHLNLIVQTEAQDISYPFAKLWSKVKPDECFWERDDNTLTLYITKLDEHTRWPQLFDRDDGVAETLTANALAAINQSLSKFTSDVQPSQHPAATDMDEDIDEVYQPVIFTIFNLAGDVVQEVASGHMNWLCSSYHTTELPSVCLQVDVDGVVFQLKEVNGSIEFQHIACFDAFAFVQASKRDARFIHHDPRLFFTSVVESSRNAYIYYHHSDKRTVETQTLVDLTQGENCDILGVELVMDNLLMALTDSDVIVMEL